MTVILAFDTSGPHCSVAVLAGDAILSSSHVDMARGQAEQLFPMVERVLSAAKVTWADLRAIGVGVGPGNFTGIRISVSAARGLSMSWNIPAIGVTSFEVMRNGLPGTGACELVCLPAPRDQVYMQAFNGETVTAPFLTSVSAEALSQLTLPTELTTVTGAQSARIATVLSTDRVFEAHPGRASAITAETVAHLAAQRFQNSDAAEKPSPLYVRPPDAAPASDPPPVVLS